MQHFNMCTVNLIRYIPYEYTGCQVPIDASGKPNGVMRYEDGTNWNMGQDGICTEHQISRMEENMFTLEFDKDAVGRDMTVMVCLDPSRQYVALAKSKALQTSTPYPGLLCITVKADKKPLTIKVE